MMNGSKQLESIYYITLPENFSLSKNAMHIDTSIPLPVQKKESDSADNFNMAELTEEQILSGILTVWLTTKRTSIWIIIVPS